MGVKGLWQLIEPVGRPIRPETLEGQRLAIDSSIWLYHFQMAMRDKSGRTLKNAHILGFLWRILKLLHLGIKPVFVFDGGAPVLKRKTLAGRRARKQGAQESHAKTASKLLNAQLREAALKHVVEQQAASKGKGRAIDDDEEERDSDADRTGLQQDLGDNVVYLEDLVGEPGPSKPSPPKDPSPSQSPARSPAKEGKPKKDYHKDPYNLPALDTDLSTIGLRGKKGTGKKDPRYATEADLRALMSSLKPEDLSISSPHFAQLPPALQYELVGDMRAHSRGTSYKRLQSMKAAAPTAADFSKQQVLGLKTRNSWTQRVLEVTDQIGSANIKVNISTDKGRIAGSRGKEYILVRNEKDGGFVLGRRAGEGETNEKAIDLEELDRGQKDDELISTDDEEGKGRRQEATTDEEFEEVAMPSSSPRGSPGKSAMSEKEKQQLAALLDDSESNIFARKEMAMQLMKKRAKAHAKQSRREAGVRSIADVIDDEEELEEVGRGAAPSKGPGLFRAGGAAPEESIDVDAEDADEEASDWDDQDVLLSDILANGTAHLALPNSMPGPPRDADESSMEDFDVDVYDSVLDAAPSPAASPSKFSETAVFEEVDGAAALRETRRQGVEDQPQGTHGGAPALGFRYQDRAGVPNGLMRSLFVRDEQRRRDFEGDLYEEPQPQPRPSSPTKVPSASPIRAPAAPKPASQQASPTRAADVEVGDERAPEPAPSKVAKQQQLAPEPALQESDPSAAGARPEADTSAAAAPLSPAPAPTGARASTSEVKAQDFAVEPAPLSAEAVKSAASPLAPADTEPVTAPSDATAETTVSESKHASAASSDHARSDPSPETAGASPAGHFSPSKVSPATIDVRSESESDKELHQEDEEADTVDSPRSEVHEGSVSPARSRSRSRSPTPVVLGADGFPLPTLEELDALDEDDEDLEGLVQRETQGLASVLQQQTTGQRKTLKQMQAEAESEVNMLKEQHAVSRRTEEDVNVQMAYDVQFMLRQFGVPYITGPMEAEAQCAELVRLGLCDGIITDDSDVFLFGGKRVFKNMFNDKTVNCFVATDIERNVGLDRKKLIQLAYLLGSDYTDGLDGVGIVLAMEILSIFKGDDGLERFRDWWLLVQQGSDRNYFPPGDFDAVERKEIKKRLSRIKKTLLPKVHLTAEWPDHHVAEAYLHPDVDSSEEDFAWGVPDLEQVRSCLMHFLGWSVDKCDQYVLPVFERVHRRGGAQSTLLGSGFFDNTAGRGHYAPRERIQFGSTRLQQVINGFRTAESERARAASAQPSQAADSEVEEVAAVASSKRKRSAAGSKRNVRGKAALGRGGRKASSSRAAEQPTEPEAAGISDGTSDAEAEEAPAPRGTSTRPARGRSRAENLRMARNMSLDDIHKLPAGRTARRSPESSRSPTR